MTEHLDDRGNWVRQRTFELQSGGLSWDEANTQAQSEADAKFSDGDNGDGETA